MEHFVWILILVAASVLLLSVRIILRKNGRFSSQHIGQSRAMRARGIHCVNTQDYEARHKTNKLNINNL